METLHTTYHQAVLAIKKRKLGNAIFKRYNYSELLSAEEAAILFPDRIKILYRHTAGMYYASPVFFPAIQSEPLIHTLNAEHIITKIHEGQIGNGSNIVILNASYAICDLSYQWDNENVWITDNMLKVPDRRHGLIENLKSQPVIKQGIYLGGNFSFNYYHFLYEFVVKLFYVFSAALDPAIPLLVDDSYEKTPQFKEIISIFNKENRAVIVLQGRQQYKVEELYSVSSPNHIVPDYHNYLLGRASDTVYDLSSLQYIREVFLANLKPRKYSAYIYLSRKNASGRRKFNEEEVYNVLGKYGFEKIHPEEYSIVEQMSMFYHASIIVAGTGAALANIICCKEGCTIISLVNYQWPFSYFSTIAAFAKAKMIYLNDTDKVLNAESKPHDEYTIDFNQLREVVDGFLNRSEIL